MKALLDTCVFIWLCDDPGSISELALGICENAENEIYLSVASIWEIQIKAAKGKLQLKTDLEAAVNLQKTVNKFRILGIDESHVFASRELPSIHNDPFDRILVAQAKSTDAVLITCDDRIKQYPVNVVW